MNNNSVIWKSAIIVALFLFSPENHLSASMPLTETIYIIPENHVELFIVDDVVHRGSYFRRDHIGFGLGVLQSMSVWFQFQYLTQDILPGNQSNVGDLFLKFQFHIGDYWNDRMHVGFIVKFRFPTGKNAYSSEDYRNLALGKNELLLGPVMQFDFFDPLFIHLNVLYIFREGKDEYLYGGLDFDIFSGEAWSKIFGLNPFYNGTFLNKEKLYDDYMALSLAFNTDAIYPVIPFVEFYCSFRTNGVTTEISDLPIEGAGINPVFLISAGFRYFFNDSIYCGFHTVVNPLWQKDYINMVYGIEVSFQL